MKRKRHSPEQIIRKLRELDWMLSEGREIGVLCQALEVSKATFHRWRNQYGGMEADEAKRLKELEIEDRRLKKAVPDLTLEKQFVRISLLAAKNLSGNRGCGYRSSICSSSRSGRIRLS